MTRKRNLGRKLKVFRLLLVLGIIILGGAGLYFFHKFQVRQHSDVLLVRAQSAFKQQDWPTAASLYQNYLNFQPRNVEAVAEYADTLEEVTKTKPSGIFDVIKTYEKLLALEANRTEQRRKLIRHYVAISSFPAARGHLSTLLSSPETAGDDAELFELAAICDERERKFSDAIESWRKAIATGKATPEAYLHLAFILRNDIASPTSEQDADAVVNDLIRAKPNDVQARLLRAKYRAQTGKTKLARDDIEYAYRNIPTGSQNVEVVLTLVALANADKDYTTAREALSKALIATPNDVRLQMTLADIQLRVGDKEEAKKTLIAASKASTKLDSSLLDIADRMIELGDATSAATIAERFAAEPATKYASDYLVGRIRLTEGNWPSAMALFQKATTSGLDRLPTQQLNALLGLADCFSLANNLEHRLKTLTAALKVEPRSFRVQLSLAECYARTGKLTQAIAIYRQLAATVPSTRADLCNLLLADIRSRADRERNWNILEDAYGPEPHAPEISVIRANALLLQNKPVEALALLEKTVAQKEATYLTGPRVALALVKANTDLKAGVEVLDDAEKAIGDRVEFRLARAAILLGTPTTEVKAIVALGENAGSFNQADRYRLYSKLGATLLDVGRRKEAMGLFQKAIAENPYDITLRASVFDLAVAEQDAPLQAQMLSELERLEGNDSPIRLTAEVMRVIKDVKQGDTARIAELRTQVELARTKRENWGPIHVLLGDLAILESNGDAALEHYRRALELGEHSDPLVRNVVRLLTERQGQPEVLDLLNRLSRTTSLPADLTNQLVLLRTAYGEDSARSIAWAKSPEAMASRNYRDHLARAAVLEVNQAKDDARKALEKAISLNENAPETWVALIRFLVSDGKMKDAQTAFTEAASKLKPIPQQPDSPATIALALGSCKELLGDFRRAEELYREAQALLPIDTAIARQLHRLLQHTGREKEATAVFEKLVTATNPIEVRCWARRMLAYGQVAQQSGQAELNAALEMIEANLQEGGNLLIDQRAKALILATDPFRQVDAINLLTDTAQKIPLTSDQSYYLGRMYIQQGQLDKAESALRDATRAIAVADPEHLAALARLQLQRGNRTAANETVTRLKSIAPNSWEAVTEEARVLAATGNKKQAAKVVLDSKLARDPTRLITRIAPVLEELACLEEAETIYTDAAKSDQPLAYTSLASFYIRNRRSAEAVKLAYDHEQTTPVGITARLLSGAARVRPFALEPEANRATWTATVRKIDEWVTKKLPLNPTNLELIYAKAELDDLFGRFDNEIKTYEAALSTNPDHEVFLNNYAVVMALHNRDGSTKPLNAINRIIAKKGPRPTYLDTRAIVHIAGERYDEAVRDLTIAISLDPRPVYYFHLAIVYEKQSTEKPELNKLRDSAIEEAAQRGLTKAMLHQKEWADFDRLIAPKLTK